MMWPDNYVQKKTGLAVNTLGNLHLGWKEIFEHGFRGVLHYQLISLWALEAETESSVFAMCSSQSVSVDEEIRGDKSADTSKD